MHLGISQTPLLGIAFRKEVDNGWIVEVYGCFYLLVFVGRLVEEYRSEK